MVIKQAADGEGWRQSYTYYYRLCHLTTDRWQIDKVSLSILQKPYLSTTTWAPTTYFNTHISRPSEFEYRPAIIALWIWRPPTLTIWLIGKCSARRAEPTAKLLSSLCRNYCVLRNDYFNLIFSYFDFASLIFVILLYRLYVSHIESRRYANINFIQITEAWKDTLARRYREGNIYHSIGPKCFQIRTRKI